MQVQNRKSWKFNKNLKGKKPKWVKLLNRYYCLDCNLGIECPANNRIPTKMYYLVFKDNDEAITIEYKIKIEYTK